MQGKDTEDNVLNASYKHSGFQKKPHQRSVPISQLSEKTEYKCLFVNTGIVFSYILCYVFFWNSVLKLK